MKRSRVALLAAAQLCCAGLMSETALAGGAATTWSDLWRTPDQQGQALLEAGQPAQAAARFHDPRRRAYADLEAGRYPEAASLLAPFTDAESEYNRGNALARSGQLQAALAAYDAALKQAPADKDIRHNRDLVERALRHQPQSSQSSPGNRGQGGHGTGSSGQQPRQSGGGRQSGSGSRQSSGASQRSGAQGPQSAGGGQTAANGSQAAAGHPGDSGQQPGSPQASNGRGSGSSKDSPGQARRDAAFAAAVARAQQQQGGKGNSSQPQASPRSVAAKPGSQGAQQGRGANDLLAGGARTPKQKPESERQLALEQWLRQIPDSPAGLLRRKFLIEHMMKQDDGGPPESGQ
jgi:Ca-activated chloride channel family protein